MKERAFAYTSFLSVGLPEELLIMMNQLDVTADSIKYYMQVAEWGGERGS